MNKDYILVFGGCSLDTTFIENKIGGYPSIPSIAVPGGKGANQAVAAARAGANVKIITRLGNDAIGKRIVENLQNNNLDTSYVEFDDKVKNDECQIFVSKEGENDIHRVVGAIDSFYVDMIEKYSSVIKGAKIVIAQMKIKKEVSVALIDFCYKNRIPIIITPCRPENLSLLDPKNLELINKITFLTCNEKESKIVFNNDNVEEIVKQFPNKAIITLGEKGAIFNDGTKNVYLPAFPVDKVVDTTGAGDTLCGNFAAALLSGYSIEQSIRIGMAASTIKITKESAQKGMPTKTQIEEFLKSYCDKKESNCHGLSY